MIQFQPDEKILMVVRRHWFLIFSKAFVFAILLAAPFFVYPFAVLAPFEYQAIIYPLLNWMIAVYFLFLWVMFFLTVVHYYLDIWVITDRRILDVVQRSLFHREVSEFAINKVQDVTVTVKGFMPTLMHFGDVDVKTASETTTLVFYSIPEPYKIQDLIIQLSQRQSPQQQ